MTRYQQVTFQNQSGNYMFMVLPNQLFRNILILAIITFIAHFWHYQNLGLYEDDYFLIAQPMSMNLGEFSDFFKWHIFNYSSTEGRPLLYIIEFSVGFLGKLIANFQSLYLINYLVILINNILVYLFLSSLWRQPIFIIAGTLAFTLYPADTNHAYLTHIFLYSSFTFLLLAFLSYFSGKKVISYLLIFASVLCYETMLPLFITAPLFKNQWNKNLLKEMLRHTLILGAMLVTVAIARKITGEARVDGLDILKLLLIPFRQMVIGPLVSLSMFLYRPAQTLLNFKGELLIFVPLFIFGFVLLLSNLKIEAEDNSDSDNNIPILSPIKKLAFLGLALLVLSYPLFFTCAATEINGRNSRVHMTAALGASILIGLFCYLIINLCNNNNLAKNLANTTLAVFFSLLVGFGLIVQQENQKTWEYQRAFWTDIVHLSPDIEPDTIILVDSPHLNTGKHLHSFIEWGVPMTLRQIYKFPKTWERLDELPQTEDKPRWYFWQKYTFYPKVYRLSLNWQDTIVNQGKFDFNPNSKAFEYFLQWELPRLIDSHNIILLQEKDGKLFRRSEPLTIGNQKFEFKSVSELTLHSFEKGALYSSLIKQDDEPSINYFDRKILLNHTARKLDELGISTNFLD
ncbi:hypothetical protein [Dolichospermum circinale]|uniref:hypothetical protein n=1 Tax=Dolichospermum circinale TaxID=109265 RepID=UPI00232C141D|nr:hypothetical protein [Dolichospermum circinale]MDB9450154.1 hypothetical protein [Dolichospermum circinale CS-547]